MPDALQDSIAAVSAGTQTPDQAAAVNAAYRNNQLPVLPTYAQNQQGGLYGSEGGTTLIYQNGVAREVTAQEFYSVYGQSPQAYENQKHETAFSQPRNDINVSPAAQAIIDQYNAQHGNVVSSSGTYRNGSLATNVSAGEGGFSGRAAAYAASWQPLTHSALYGNESTVERISTVPVHDISSNAPTYQDTHPYTMWDLAALENAQNRPGFTPISSMGDTTTQSVRMATEMMRMFGANIATPDTVVARTLEQQRQMAWYTPGIRDNQFFGNELQKWAENKVEVASAYHHIGMGAGVPIPANRFEYQGDLAVEFLKGEPHKASERFSPVSGEMAPNLPGGEGLQEYMWNQAIANDKMPGSKIYETWYTAGVEKIVSAEGQYGPYGVLWGAPGNAGGPPLIEPRTPYLSQSVAPEVAAPEVQATQSVQSTPAPTFDVSQWVTGAANAIKGMPVLIAAGGGFGAMAAPTEGTITTRQSTTVVVAEPTPFSQVTNELPIFKGALFATSPAAWMASVWAPKPSMAGGFGAMAANEGANAKITVGSQEGPEFVAPARESPQGITPYQQSVLGGYSGGLIGYALWGEKSPEVIKGGVGSVIDFFPAMVGWTPVADRMRVTDAGQTDYLAGKTEREATLQTYADFGKTNYGVDEQGRIKINTETPGAVKFQNDYEALRTDYGSYMKSGVEKGYTKYSNGQLVVNQDLTYDYGEYSKWGAGAGAQVRQTLGFNKEQLENYGTQLEQKQGIQYIPEKIVYGAGYTLSTHPEKIVTAYGAGLATVGVGEIAGVVAEGTGLTAAAAGFGTAHPTIAAVSGAALRYGVPAVLIGATYYGASEGLTATPERTTINIGKLTPELGGFMYGGMTGYGVLRAADAGYLGFQNRPQTAKEALGQDVLQVADLGADQSWRYNLPQTSPATEPYAMLGSTRVPLSEFKVAADIGQRPMGELPGVRETISGSDMMPNTMATELGFRDLGKTQTSAAFSMDKLIEDMGLYNQPASAKTTSMRAAQEAAWQPLPSTGELPMDWLPGVSRITGLEPAALPNPFAGLADRMGVSIEPASPKGIGMSTEAGYGYSGAPMSEQMLMSVVTRGPIVESAVYRSAMDTVIGQEAARMRVAPATEAAVRESIVPSATESTFKQGKVELPAFEETLQNVLESEKRGSQTSQTQVRTPVPHGFMETIIDTQNTLKSPAAPQVSWKSWSPQSVQAAQVTGRIQLATQTPSIITATLPSQIPAVARAGAQTVAPAVALTNVLSPATSTRQTQTPFTANIQLPSQAVIQAQTPATIQTTTQTTRQVMDNPFAPLTSTPERSLTEKPFAPTISEPYTTVTPSPYPDPKPWTPTTPTPEIKPPTGILPPMFGGIPGQGGSGGQRKGHRRYLEYFPLGLDLSTWGASHAHNPFTEGLGTRYVERKTSIGGEGSRVLKRTAEGVQTVKHGMKPVSLGKKKNIFMK